MRCTSPFGTMRMSITPIKRYVFNVLYMDYSSFVKVDQAEYVPENLD